MSSREHGFTSLHFLFTILLQCLLSSSFQNNVKSPIENVDAKTLEALVENERQFVVFFYAKICRNCDKLLQDLQTIYHGEESFTWKFVKHDEMVFPKYHGVKKYPALVHFRNKQPIIYDGDIANTESVVLWLNYTSNSKVSDSFQELSAKDLQYRIDDAEYFVVLFSNGIESTGSLQTFKTMCEEASDQGVTVFTIDNLSIAAEFGFEALPALVSYKNKEPFLYQGNVTDEQEILKWLLRYKNNVTGSMENISGAYLASIIENSTSVAVLFYDNATSTTDLRDAIEIHAKDSGILFASTEDPQIASDFGIVDFPALVLFEEKHHIVYQGDLSQSSNIKKWLLKQEDGTEHIATNFSNLNLKTLAENSSFLAVLLFDKMSRNNYASVLEVIEKNAELYNIPFVALDSIPDSNYGISDLPAIIAFEDGVATVYKGNLNDTQDVQSWLLQQMQEADNIYKPESDLASLIHNSTILVVLFQDDVNVNQEIENAITKNGIPFIRIDDLDLALQYGNTTTPTLVCFYKRIPSVYQGNFNNIDDMLDWLLEIRDRPERYIEYVNRRDLDIMLEGQAIAVIFYDENCTECDKILRKLEDIDDDVVQYGLQILKTDDVQFATELGVSVIPSLVYFENMIPSIYDGIMDEVELLKWLVQQKTEDTIENINRDMLFRMIEEQEYLGVYFYKENDKESKDILKHLEQIDDDCSDYEVTLLKMCDHLMAKKYKIRNPPGLVFFRHGAPIKYSGDLNDEEEVLDYLTSPDNMESSDTIEKVNKRMLERVLTRSDFLAVFFYKRTHCRRCTKALEELEKIDDDAEQQGIQFVKIEDLNLSRAMGVFSIPSLVFFRYGNTEDPVIFSGDLKNGKEILNWLVSQKDPGSDMIEEMDGDELEDLIEEAEFLAVLFYDPDEDDCPQCADILADLENIDDDTDRHGILFVKTRDDSIAAIYGINNFPALIYFENFVPSIYEGDLSAEEEVLQWLIHSKSEDTIETVNKDMCEKLIQNTPYLVVVFYKQQTKASDEVLERLENIDGFTDEYGVQMVKTQDSSLARRYGVSYFPALVFYRNLHPMVYKGDLNNETAVLNWILSDATLLLSDEIEEITTKMLAKLIDKYQLLAVLFYEKECDKCENILSELEDIDEKTDLFGIGFVKISEPAAALHWSVQETPALAYFRKRSPVFYEGSLEDAETVLDWLTSQDMTELKNEIEEVSRKMLEKLLVENYFIAVYFYDDGCEICEHALRQLEIIDDEVEELDIAFVKIKDSRCARKYGVKDLPTLTYFRKNFPTQYKGDLMDRRETLNWLKKNRYRRRELNLFMFSMIAMGAIFIQYSLFLKFCFEPFVEK